MEAKYPLFSPIYLSEDFNQFHVISGAERLSRAVVMEGKLKVTTPSGQRESFDSVKDWLVWLEYDMNMVGKYDSVLFVGFKNLLDFTSETMRVTTPITQADPELQATLKWPAPMQRKKEAAPPPPEEPLQTGRIGVSDQVQIRGKKATIVVGFQGPPPIGQGKKQAEKMLTTRQLLQQGRGDELMTGPEGETISLSKLIQTIQAKK